MEEDILNHHKELFSADGTPITPTVNCLSDAAKWELWHQRLAHPGNRIMEQRHIHADGVPALRGNVFFQCPSCMKNKLCTKQTGNQTNLGSCQYCLDGLSKRSAPDTTTASDNANDMTNTEEWDEYLDDLHLPDALPGQHSHINFGFVQGSDFKVLTGKKGKGPTLTSIDAKNSYCITVDGATRYIWVHLDNTKQPPIDQVRMVLQKFGNKQITHRMVIRCPTCGKAICCERTETSNSILILPNSTIHLKTSITFA